MKDPLKSNYRIIIAVLLVCLFTACSNSSSNKKTNSSESSLENNKSKAVGLKSNICQSPLNVTIPKAIYQSAGNYQLTYSWNSVNNASSYIFKFYINGTVAFQNLTVKDTFLTISQTISANDSFHATVGSTCGSQTSNTAKASFDLIYLNAVSTDDIVYLVNPNTDITDICSKNCQKLGFIGNSFKNSDGSIIYLSSPSMKNYFYDFNTVKNCIKCSSSGTPIVDPIAFNNCLNNPLNQFWLYDPGAYQICP